MIQLTFGNIDRLKQVQEYIKKRVDNYTKQIYNRCELRITHENEFSMVVTDGFTLIRRVFEIEIELDPIHVNNVFYIDLESIKQLKPIVFKSDYTTIKLDDDMVIIESNTAGKIKRSLLEYSECNAPFIDYKQVVPEETSIGMLCFSFKNLESIARALDSDIIRLPIDINADKPNIELITYKPLVLDNDRENINILMPIRNINADKKG